MLRCQSDCELYSRLKGSGFESHLIKLEEDGKYVKSRSRLNSFAKIWSDRTI